MRSPLPRRLWVAAAAGAAIVFFLIALRRDVYDETSPAHIAMHVFGSTARSVGDPFGISLHVVIRKAYSIVAFALVCFLYAKAMALDARRALSIVLFGALFSAAIEAGQRLHHVHEGLGWNAVDVACGAAGGGVAALFLRGRTTA